MYYRVVSGIDGTTLFVTKEEELARMYWNDLTGRPRSARLRRETDDDTMPREVVDWVTGDVIEVSEMEAMVREYYVANVDSFEDEYVQKHKAIFKVK